MSTVRLSERARQTEDQPISYFMQTAIDNPQLISLAAGFVDPESLPADDVRLALDEILSDPRSAQAALQYGTTQGYGPLREKILAHVLSQPEVQACAEGLGQLALDSGSRDNVSVIVIEAVEVR